MAERLFTSLAGLVAEVLAGAVEYKNPLLHPEQIVDLISSSFFKEEPTKLDLTLCDLSFYFDLALEGFVRFANNKDVQLALANDIGTAGAAEVLHFFALRTAAWLDRVYRPDFVYETSSDGVLVNVFTRVALNFLGMQAHFNSLYRRMAAAPFSTDVPDRRFYDILVFTIGSFLEHDLSRNFWHLDEVMTYFEAHFERFHCALATVDDDDDRAPPS
jgi:hypothetical protein